MRIPYGKRRYVPDRCPKCGKTQEVIASPLGSGLPNPSTYAALHAYIVTWTKELGEHPSEAFAGTPWWWGRCGNCTINQILTTPPAIIAQPIANEWRMLVGWLRAH